MRPVSGLRGDGLLVGFMADHWPAQHHFQTGPGGFEQADDLGGLRHIPDVHTKTDDLHRAAMRQSAAVATSSHTTPDCFSMTMCAPSSR